MRWRRPCLLTASFLGLIGCVVCLATSGTFWPPNYEALLIPGAQQLSVVLCTVDSRNFHTGSCGNMTVTAVTTHGQHGNNNNSNNATERGRTCAAFDVSFYIPDNDKESKSLCPNPYSAPDCTGVPQEDIPFGNFTTRHDLYVQDVTDWSTAEINRFYGNDATSDAANKYQPRRSQICILYRRAQKQWSLQRQIDDLALSTDSDDALHTSQQQQQRQDNKSTSVLLIDGTGMYDTNMYTSMYTWTILSLALFIMCSVCECCFTVCPLIIARTGQTNIQRYLLLGR